MMVNGDAAVSPCLAFYILLVPLSNPKEVTCYTPSLSNIRGGYGLLRWMVKIM